MFSSISDVSVTLSLFDSQSIKFHTKLEAVRGDPRAVVATSIHPKIVVCFSMPHHGHTSISTRRLMLGKDIFTSCSIATLSMHQQLHC